ncbi:LysM peptidoglycan-binding domain-containing protein [Viridibacillus sp. FSL R5-0477]|uniref:Peptidoglycan hydrolase n=1 Tax=Viridibacillus arenosi FSL R5-213 TaxID=1227360 RepID=W4F4V6_9BACL|nr:MULTISPECIES: peptidoglycan endopeptidase [Viridibacillus]ETT87898.1 peptidoglycan hydrolase [Viridibacillus arenosi FSL R5-213]OMC81652.1 peptidoglycan endopeptidase [Viridibacillus sp. FSL H8-0123]OMC89177.1 peptidoglycan endopeptidase [Viridibacillus sp. FSL H7-0596]OMC89907.1 peptidoglycan endopeptidase [Viridibacillus arenosi]
MKKATYSILATGALALCINSQSTEASSNTYTVKSGDSLYTIALKHGTTVTKLKKSNNLKSDIIYPKQKLLLSGKVSTQTSKAPSNTANTNAVSPSSNTATYKVKQGDTLSKISTKYKVSVSALQKTNNIKDHLIFVGQKIKIPTTTTNAGKPTGNTTKPKPDTTTKPSNPTNVNATSYKVAAGDTLSGIAYKFGITITQLKSWNGLTSDLIRVGQTLKVKNSSNSTIQQDKENTTNVSKPTAPTVSTNEIKQKAVSLGLSLQNTPYVWGGQTPAGFDCSGFIHYVFNNAGLSMTRTNAAGYEARSYYINTPQVGDLVFFRDTYQTGISHLGIYIGNGQFVHAGGTHVQVSSVNEPYWAKHFDSYKRFYSLD